MGLNNTDKNKILYGENNYQNESFDQVLNRFENEIRKEFLWEDWETDFQQEIKRKRMENVMKLTRLEICNICYLEEYTCSFEELYYKCEFDKNENTICYYNDLYFIKIPNPWGKRIMLEYNKEYGDTTQIDTLGNRIRFARNRISKWCADIRDKRLMKKQNWRLYCSKFEDPPKFGCSDKIGPICKVLWRFGP